MEFSKGLGSDESGLLLGESDDDNMSELRSIHTGLDARRSKLTAVEKRFSNPLEMVEAAEGDRKNHELSE